MLAKKNGFELNLINWCFMKKSFNQTGFDFIIKDLIHSITGLKNFISDQWNLDENLRL